MGTFTGGAAFGSGPGGPAGSPNAKLARLQQLMGQQPQLRQAVQNLIDKAVALQGAGGAVLAASDGVAMLRSIAQGPGLAAAGRGGGRGGNLGGAARGSAPRGPDLAPAAERPSIVDLHKSWHMFHFVFTGRASGGTPPASFLMEGGEPIGEDLGYGPARLLNPALTAALAAFVAPLTVDESKGRLDGERMAALSIYPAFDADDAEEEYGEDIEHYFPKLRDHFGAASAVGEATLVWLS